MISLAVAPLAVAPLAVAPLAVAPLAVPLKSMTLKWPGRVLALAFAFLAGCPVLANLIGTYLADGNSFAITASIACAALLLAGIAALRLGIPREAITGLRGPLLALAVIGVVFWTHWILVNLISPSPQPMMRYQVFQAAVWMLLPMLLFLLWRQYIDAFLVLRILVVLDCLFVLGLTLRWVLDLGIYHSGRWHAGLSLEAIRSGRYATMALWVFALAALCPAAVMPTRLKLAALACLPLALLMMVAANARGPWLALAITVAVTGIPLARLLAERIRRDARVVVVVLLAVAVAAGFVASQIAGVESDFGRLTTLTEDGGSAAGRLTLVHDHLQLLRDTPMAVLSGCGYGHGLFYPHNVMIEALVNGGVIQFSLFIAMISVTFGVIFWVWRSRSRSGADDVPSLLVAGLFLLSLIGNPVSGSIAGDLTWFFPLLLLITAKRSQVVKPLLQGFAPHPTHYSSRSPFTPKISTKTAANHQPEIP